LGDSYQGEKVISKGKRITPKVGERRSFLLSERLSIKSNFLSIRERASRSKPLSKRRKTFEDPK